VFPYVFAGEFAAIMVEKVAAWVKLQFTWMK